MSTRNQKLMDEVHAVMRLKHYSIHMERSSCYWIKRFVHFHNVKSRHDLKGGEPKIEQFLTHRAGVKAIHEKDITEGFGAVNFPYALERKNPNATMIYTHVVGQGAHGVASPLDDLVV